MICWDTIKVDEIFQYIMHFILIRLSIFSSENSSGLYRAQKSERKAFSILSVNYMAQRILQSIEILYQAKSFDFPPVTRREYSPSCHIKEVASHNSIMRGPARRIQPLGLPVGQINDPSSPEFANL